MSKVAEFKKDIDWKMEFYKEARSSKNHNTLSHCLNNICDISKQFHGRISILGIIISYGLPTLLNQALQKPDIDLNTECYLWLMPLHYTIQYDMKTSKWLGHVFNVLLEHPKIDINKKDIHGRTPLHLAILFNQVDKITKLLGHPDIDVDLKTSNGESPMDLAVEGGNTDIINLFNNKNN